MDRVAVWEATKRHYAAMAPQNSLVVDALGSGPLPRPYATVVTWHAADCVDVAIALKGRGKPLLLNMASDFQPGGGVWKGASAQEEELFRRSNYHKFLHRRWYPFPPLRVILSRDVEFYRASAAEGYAVLPTPVILDCIAVAGIRRPETDGKRFLQERDAETLRLRLRMLCRTAVENGNDVLVLSALGCGAFRGPIPHIAQILREVVEEYHGCFKEIAFAILGDTYGPFRRAFG